MEFLMASRPICKLNTSVNLITSCRIICNSSFYTENKCVAKRYCTSENPVNPFSGDRSTGSYTKGPKVSEVFKKIINDPKILLQNMKSLKEEVKLVKKEWQDALSFSHLHNLEPGEVDMLFTFDTDDDINKFMVSTDKANNQGYSTASFVRTQNETALFSGFIDTKVPEDGNIRKAGFAAIMSRRILKSFRRFATYDWSCYSHLVLKVRGDGRNYCIILGCPSSLDVTFQDQFHYPLYTRGGPYWQIVKIPFSDFYFTSRGRIQDRQEVMPLDACSRVGITLADGNTGPFKLEIEYFGLEYKPYSKLICPYEHYSGKMIADV